MILEVRIPDGHSCYRRRQGRGDFVTYERKKPLVTTVQRIFSDVRCHDGGAPSVQVDAWIPEQHRKGIRQSDPRWIEPGVFRALALVSRNEKTLAAFFASGDSEWDFREDGA